MMQLVNDGPNREALCSHSSLMHHFLPRLCGKLSLILSVSASFVEPRLPGGKIEWPAQKTFDQLRSRAAPPRREYLVAVRASHFLREHVRAVEFAEQVFGYHKRPHIRVVNRRVAIQMSERGLKMCPVDVRGTVELRQLLHHLIGINLFRVAVVNRKRQLRIEHLASHLKPLPNSLARFICFTSAAGIGSFVW